MNGIIWSPKTCAERGVFAVPGRQDASCVSDEVVARFFFDSESTRPRTLYWAWTIICMPKMNIMMPLTCGTDTVATHRSRATCRCSYGRVDGVEAMR